MRIEVSQEAADFVLARGGRLWVWSARPAMCCSGTPAFMYAATQPPHGIDGFGGFEPVAGLQVNFRAPSGRMPDVLEIGLHGKVRRRVEAYWDGCLMAL